jgi:hypothetical protein
MKPAACYRWSSILLGTGLNEMTNRSERFNWWLPLSSGAGTLVVFLLVLTTGDFVLRSFFYELLVVPSVTIPLVLTALVAAIRHNRLLCLSALSILVVHLAVSWALCENSLAVRTECRWLLWSKSYKARVLSQPEKANGELRHVELDGWGFAGAGDTIEYLVYDPNDSLSAAAADHSHGRFKGIPCEVFSVRRLQRHWYSTLFYTDTDWDQC